MISVILMGPNRFAIQAFCSDLVTDITSGTGKGYFWMPFAATVQEARIGMLDAPTGSTAIFDVNESGATILSTKISVDAGEETSVTAATPPVISDAVIADNAKITIDFDQVGSTNPGKGVLLTLIVTIP